MSTPPVFIGGGERDRTDDLLRARQALSHLSYTPNSIAAFGYLISELKPAIRNGNGGPSWN
jgi:hypothetical protein